MSDFYDTLETRTEADREAALFAALPLALATSAKTAPAWGARFAGTDLSSITSHEALAALPVTRKADLMRAQAETPPFGGFIGAMENVARIFVSPGPVLVAEGREADPWSAARALYAAGVRAGDIVANTFGYHMTPGAFILESGLAALGCPIIAAGAGNADQQIEMFAAAGARVYCGVPDYLNILLDKAEDAGTPLTFRTALVSGAALPPALRERIEARGVALSQAYATADLGVIAYESPAREGLILNEGLILEIVRPGTGEPIHDGEVGEVVVTRMGGPHPLFRFATGDLSAILPGASPCGRTNRRIRGWMGRADQRTKVKGMFVDPAQIAAVMTAHPELGKARLVVTRSDHVDTMTLRCEGLAPADAEAVAATLHRLTNLKGRVEPVPPGSLPNDGKVVADERAITD